MTHLIRTLLILLSAAFITSCSSRNRHAAVPKPEGWPRIEVPGQNYTEMQIGDAIIMFNSEATVASELKSNGSRWINVTYPQFRKAQIYLTLTPVAPDELQTVTANRHERMELNAGGAATELTSLTSDGQWACELAETRSSLTTPLQLLAYDDSGRHVLSGALYLDIPPATAHDSIAPIVSAIKNDMLAMLKHLR